MLFKTMACGRSAQLLQNAHSIPQYITGFCGCSIEFLKFISSRLGHWHWFTIEGKGLRFLSHIWGAPLLPTSLKQVNTLEHPTAVFEEQHYERYCCTDQFSIRVNIVAYGVGVRLERCNRKTVTPPGAATPIKMGNIHSYTYILPSLVVVEIQ